MITLGSGSTVRDPEPPVGLARLDAQLLTHGSSEVVQGNSVHPTVVLNLRRGAFLGIEHLGGLSLDLALAVL